MKIRFIHQQNGMILPIMIFVLMAFTVTLLAIANFSVNQYSRNTKNLFATNSLMTAEAGAEQSLDQLNNSSSFSGYATEQEFFNNSTQGRGTYQTTVSNGSQGNEKIIISTGRVYSPNSNQAKYVRKVKLIVVGTSTGGQYSVFAGAGGLLLNGSGTIPNGPVKVNGRITMSGNPRIGSVANPVSVEVANYACPQSSPFTLYPILCIPAQGQAITASGSSHIYGTVCATGQTNGSFMSHTGLQTGCVAPNSPLPPHDRDAIKNATTSTITGTAAGCNNGTRNWAANLHITGNVTINGNCTVTINGNVWIDGNLGFNGSGRIVIANGLTTAPTIMIDGSSGLSVNGSGRIVANTNSIAALVVTYYSAASCSPNCTDVTGTDLYNTRNSVTISLNGTGSSPGTLFYARWSKISVNGGGSHGGTYGQTVEINGSGNIVFGTQLSSGTSIWSIKNYQQIF